MKVWTLILACVVAMVGCAKPAKPTKPPVEVTTVTVEPQTIPIQWEFVGVAKSSHPVEIRARVESYLWSIDYVEGNLVKSGDLLFRLDPRQYEEELNAARGELKMYEATLWRAQQNLDRIKPLYLQNAMSKKDLDDATANVEAAKAKVFAGQANVANAQLNLSYTKITTPVTGLSGRAAFQDGSLIVPNVNGLLTTVSVIDPIWVLFSVSDQQLLEVRGQIANEHLIVPAQEEYTIQLELSDGSQFPQTGKVNFASPTLDPETGAMTVRATFANPDALIRPGQFVRATVSGAQRKDTIVVPQTAVSQSANGMYVFVVDNGVAHMRLVEPGNWYKNSWIINKGLEAGDVVIATGVNRVQDGTPVTVKAPSSSHSNSE